MTQITLAIKVPTLGIPLLPVEPSAWSGLLEKRPSWSASKVESGPVLDFGDMATGM